MSEQQSIPVLTEADICDLTIAESRMEPTAESTPMVQPASDNPSLVELMNAMMNKMDKRFDENSENINDLKKDMNSRFENLEDKLNKKIENAKRTNDAHIIKLEKEVTKKFETTHLQIIDIEQQLNKKIQQVEIDYKSGNAEVHKQLNDTTNTLNERINLLPTDHQQITKISKEAVENKLTLMESSIGVQLSNIHSRLDKLDDSLDERIDLSVDAKYRSLDEEIDRQSQLSDLVRTMNRNDEELSDRKKKMTAKNLAKIPQEPAHKKFQRSVSFQDQATPRDNSELSNTLSFLLANNNSTISNSLPFINDNNNTHPMEFIEKVDKLLQQANMENSQKLNIAISRMGGKFRSWAEAFSTDWSTFDEFKADFISQFWSIHIQQYLINDLYTLKHAHRYNTSNARVDLKELVYNWKRNLKYINIPVPEEILVEYLIKHYNPTIQGMLIAAKVTSTKELLQILEKIQNNFNMGNNLNNTDSFSDNSRSNSYNFRHNNPFTRDRSYPRPPFSSTFINPQEQQGQRNPEFNQRPNRDYSRNYNSGNSNNFQRPNRYNTYTRHTYNPSNRETRNISPIEPHNQPPTNVSNNQNQNLN